MIDEPETRGKENEADDHSVMFPIPEGQTQADESSEPKHRTQHIMRRFVAFWRNFWRLLERGNRGFWQRIQTGFMFADKHSGAISAMATVTIMVLTSFYVSYSKKQWGEMRNARRPWLGLSQKLSVKQPFSFTRFKATMSNLDNETDVVVTEFELSGTLQNFGSSPARRVVTTFEILEFGNIRYLFRDSSCKIADAEARGVSVIDETASTFIMPAQAIFPNVSVPIEPNKIKFSHFADKSPEMPDHLWLVGCVAYIDTFGEVHHTKVLYRSLIPDGEQSKVGLSDPPVFTYKPFTEFTMEDSDSD